MLPEGPYRDSRDCAEERVHHVDHSYSIAARPPGSRGQTKAPAEWLTEDVLFGDVWERAEFSPRDRSLVTIAALTAGGNSEQTFS